METLRMKIMVIFFSTVVMGRGVECRWCLFASEKLPPFLGLQSSSLLALNFSLFPKRGAPRGPSALYAEDGAPLLFKYPARIIIAPTLLPKGTLEGGAWVAYQDMATLSPHTLVNSVTIQKHSIRGGGSVRWVHCSLPPGWEMRRWFSRLPRLVGESRAQVLLRRKPDTVRPSRPQSDVRPTSFAILPPFMVLASQES
ncbi:hypothetical protein B0F90DRAFT_1741218 [Multifurca ochricompacta]|uniref:Uncharacterized protein n=1 Tax=Multifurca ochricompacta TaxID=376703 RepID=A0AAD4M2D6_9AGAM|nr:hypothetical protein B0F90DRAFT_1741218 [Multifurca ochricompacta]